MARSREASGSAQAGQESSFLRLTKTLPPGRAQLPQGPKATATKATDISCRAVPPTAQGQQETRHRGRARPPTPPAKERKSLSEGKAGRLTPPAGEGAQPPPRHPGGPRGARSPSNLGKLRLGLWEGPRCSSPGGEEQRVRLELWFRAELKRARDRNWGSERGREDPQPSGFSRSPFLQDSRYKGSRIRKRKSGKDLGLKATCSNGDPGALQVPAPVATAQESGRQVFEQQESGHRPPSLQPRSQPRARGPLRLLR